MELLDDNYGNKAFDKNIIKVLKSVCNLTVSCQTGWFDEREPGVKYYEYDYSKNKNGTSRKAVYSRNYQSIKVAVSLDKKHKFDYIFFASYHTVLFPIVRLLVRRFKKRVFILHHNNIDNINKSFRLRLLFRTYSKAANHFVLEPFIKNHLIEKYHIKSSKIFYLPHPLNINNLSGSIKMYDCVGISNSNDESFVKSVISFENQTKAFKKSGKKVILRSKEYQYDDDYLKIIKGKLTDDEYLDYINRARVMFLPFPETFQFRTSGTVVDAFSNHISVVGTHIPLLVSLSKDYPSICSTISTVEDFAHVILYGRQVDNLDFEKYIELHSDDKIEDVFKTTFGL